MAGILALIPARGGSRRLPGKNTRPFEGRPLIAHTIEAARGCSDVDRVVVSTDDPDIARAALDAGAEVPFMRPAALSTDVAGSMEVVFHALDTLRDREGYATEALFLLQPTSPLRRAAHLTEAVALHRSTAPACPVVSVVASKPPSWLYRSDADGVLSPLFAAQAAPTAPAGGGLWWPNGAFWLATVEFVRRHGGFVGPGTRPYPMAPSESVDIDTLDDFELAEAICRYRGGPAADR
jgi:CMP-N,N'-diacetyllegionaminic acid synthase